jgi:hypothetical protein
LAAVRGPPRASPRVSDAPGVPWSACWWRSSAPAYRARGGAALRLTGSTRASRWGYASHGLLARHPGAASAQDGSPNRSTNLLLNPVDGVGAPARRRHARCRCCSRWQTSARGRGGPARRACSEPAARPCSPRRVGGRQTTFLTYYAQETRMYSRGPSCCRWTAPHGVLSCWRSPRAGGGIAPGVVAWTVLLLYTHNWGLVPSPPACGRERGWCYEGPDGGLGTAPLVALLYGAPGCRTTGLTGPPHRGAVGAPAVRCYELSGRDWRPVRLRRGACCCCGWLVIVAALRRRARGTTAVRVLVNQWPGAAAARWRG